MRASGTFTRSRIINCVMLVTRSSGQPGSLKSFYTVVLIAPRPQKPVDRKMIRQQPRKVKKMRKALKPKSKRNLQSIWMLRIPLIKSQPSYESRFPRCLPK